MPHTGISCAFLCVACMVIPSGSIANVVYLNINQQMHLCLGI